MNSRAQLKSLFPVTHNMLHRHGRSGDEFSKLAISPLNPIIRPFTTCWHRLSERGAFNVSAQCQTFLQDLTALQ